MKMVNFYGRKQIFADVDEINESNILKILPEIYNLHESNRAQIKYLYEYYKGNQPIYQREKEIRPEICNKIVENWANAIVSFKVGYLCGSPVQYISGKSKIDITEQIDRLNDIMDSHGKASVDKDLIEWQMICGTSYRSLFSDETDLIDTRSFNTSFLLTEESSNRIMVEPASSKLPISSPRSNQPLSFAKDTPPTIMAPTSI